MGFGAVTPDMAVTMTALLDRAQELANTGPDGNFKMRVITMSAEQDPLMPDADLRRFWGPSSPSVAINSIDQVESSYHDVKQYEEDAIDWRLKVVGTIKNIINAWQTSSSLDETSAPAVILLTSYQDAWWMYGHDLLTAYDVSFHAVHPTTEKDEVYEATAEFVRPRLVWVSTDVSSLARVDYLRAVFVAPEFQGCIFENHHEGSMLQTKAKATVNIPFKIRMAKSFISRAPNTPRPKQVDVHVFDGNKDLPAPSPSLLEDCDYLNLAVISRKPRSITRGQIPYRLPENKRIVATSIDRLLQSKLIGAEPQGQVLKVLPAGEKLAKWIGYESSLPALILLAAVGPELSPTVNMVLIELAMVVAHGLSSCFIPGVDAKAVMEMVATRFQDVGPVPQGYLRRGNLWLWVAVLNIARKNRLDRICNKSDLKAMETRIDDWARRLTVLKPGEVTMLTEKELLVVEKHLVGAFLHKILRFKSRLEATDMATGVVVVAATKESDCLDWFHVSECARKTVYAVHTGLSKGEAGEYRAVDATAVSLDAMCEAFRECGKRRDLTKLRYSRVVAAERAQMQTSDGGIGDDRELDTLEFGDEALGRYDETQWEDFAALVTW